MRQIPTQRKACRRFTRAIRLAFVPEPLVPARPGCPSCPTRRLPTAGLVHDAALRKLPRNDIGLGEIRLLLAVLSKGCYDGRPHGRSTQVRKTLHVGYGAHFLMSQNIATLDEPPHLTKGHARA